MKNIVETNRYFVLGKVILLSALAAIIGIIVIYLGNNFLNLPADAPLLLESTPQKLAVWVAQQATEDAPTSLLGQWAKQSAEQNGLESVSEANLIRSGQAAIFYGCLALSILYVIGAAAIMRRAVWVRVPFLVGLIGCVCLLFIFPTLPGESSMNLSLLAVGLTVILLVFAEGKVSRLISFFVTVAILLMGWEITKIFADANQFAIRIAQPSWTYTAYPTLDTALAALEANEITAVFADENDLKDLMTAYPEDEPLQNPAYPDLRHVALARQEQILIFPVIPDFSGRLAVAVRQDDVATYQKPSELIGESVGAVEGDFAIERYLAVPRELVLIDLQIFNDLNLPHLQAIASAFLQPARRNGEMLLVRILGEAGLYTWGEAVFGFVFGALLGFGLGVVFAHSPLMERALLPYVVASQTVPILAIAPMVVIWLGASAISVAIIAVYITFFPVTINTLRGLLSPNPTAVELMQSYAANRWTILWKLRFPSALPYIFASLKVSATASVVGAIIGELPSGISEGLGRAILNFSSDYSAVSTPKLWAAIITAAFVGVIFFVIISIIERMVLRRYVRSGDLSV
jgi:NitT/TauT family transport system permease protein